MPTLWSGRFGDKSDALLRALSDSLHFDRRLFAQDIAASRAHTRMLAAVGLVDDDEANAIVEALDSVEDEFRSGTFQVEPSDEDIHTAVERRVSEITPAGAKLHTGRSRNDQVATDLRLFTRGAIDDIASLIRDLQVVLLDKAEGAGDATMAAYTHLQRAQKVSVAHHLLSHAWALQRDITRLRDTRNRVDVSPLGAGAIAGTSLPIDVALTGEELGFGEVFDNSIDAVGDRDFIAETLFDITLLAVHLSRLAEDMILWSSTEFGFLTLDDRFSTGSSMMPQKKNPDVAELARGKVGRTLGNLIAVLTTLKGLPSGYNKDLQEDKQPLFDSIDTVALTLPALTGTVKSASLSLDAMEASASDPLLSATHLAEWLVSRGIPFRESHALVAGLVRSAISGEGEFRDLVAGLPELGPDAWREVVEAGPGGVSHGSGSPDDVRRQIERLRGLVAAR